MIAAFNAKTTGKMFFHMTEGTVFLIFDCLPENIYSTRTFEPLASRNKRLLLKNENSQNWLP